MNDFWVNNGDKILVGIITAIVVLFLSEPLKALFKKVGIWVETGFQSLGFGFQKRYYHALIEGHKWLKLIGIYNPADLHAPRLQEVYISLRLNTAKDSPNVVWSHVFNDNEKHMVILGQPGAGKSTLLDYLTLIFTGFIKHPLPVQLGKPLPIFVRLRDLGKTDVKQSLLGLIESSDNIGLKNVPAGYFDRHLKSGNCVVLLDGLDEVLDENYHKQVVKEIQTFANEYPDNWLVVTCRVAGWHEQLPNFRQYTVEEFDSDDVRQFIGAWYREVTRTEAINRLGISPKVEAVQDAEAKAYHVSLQQSELLWEALVKNESLLRIARTPLILSLVTLVHKNRTTDLPKGRARLYRECLEILLDLWDAKDKGLTIPDSPSLNDKLMVLKTIAFHFIENGLIEMDKAGLEDLVTPFLSSLTKQVTSASLIRQIYERSGVLVEQRIGKYGFAHRALYDYLAASYITEENLDSLLVKHAGEEPWREVILISIGLVKPHQRAEALLKSLLQQSDENAASLALAGWSLAEDVQISENLRLSVKKKILERLNLTETSSDFSLLSSALFDTDSTSMYEWMQSVLLGRDPNLRIRVLNKLLPELGPEKGAPFVSIVTKILTDSHSETDIRIHAASVLAKIAHTPDNDVWNALESARREKDKWLKATATWAWCELGRYEELGLVKVPAGDFLMGSTDNDRFADDSEKPQHTVYLPGFYIAKYPVTTQEFKTFVKESKYQPQHPLSMQGTDTHPVVYVTYQDAIEFASWYGFSLPSEAEWEKAARGTDGRVFPWGNTWKSNYANTNEYWEGTRGLWSKLIRRRVEAGTTSVQTFSSVNISPYACIDMVGNVWEWTRSLYFEYPYSSLDGRESVDVSEKFVLRGGSFENTYSFSRISARYALAMNFPGANRGFRVCVSLSAKEQE